MLAVELFGATCQGQNPLWDAKCSRDKTDYQAKCKVSKKELQEHVKNGTVLDVEEVARRESGEKGAMGTV